MGPNGSGKSTLAYVLAGRPGYEVTQGSVTLDGEDLLAMEPHERAAHGMFLGFQYPVEIPGVSNVQFLRTALNAQRRARGETELSAGEFLKLAREQADALGLDMEMMKRAVNVGFSGGEKKRNEMVQMGIIDPRLAILDETNSGLDIDALRVIGAGINRILRKPDKAVLLITHYQRLLDIVEPDFVHVLAGGRIVRSGGPELAARARARRLWGDGGMTALDSRSPSLAQRERRWRWSDLSALPSARRAARRPGGCRTNCRGSIATRASRLLFVDGALRDGDVEIGPLGDRDRATRSAASPARTGWSLKLGRDQAPPGLVQIVHVSTGAADHLAAEIVLDDDAQASIVETYIGEGWTNRLTGIALGKGARLMLNRRVMGDAGFVSLTDQRAASAKAPAWSRRRSPSAAATPGSTARSTRRRGRLCRGRRRAARARPPAA